MPKINLTDTNIKKQPFCDSPTWFSHETDKYPGLRLCVTKSAKTFYVAKWDPTTSKTRQVKLGRFAPAYGVAMAWEDAQDAIRLTDAGLTLSRVERDAQRAAAEAEARKSALPTLTQATEEFLLYRVNMPRAAGRPMAEDTAKKYRRAVERHLSRWAGLPIDKLPTFEIKQHLNAMQHTTPQGAMYVHAVIGTVLRWHNEERGLELRIPSLTTPTKISDRKETRDKHGNVKLDMTVAWDARWAEIEALQNPSIKALWELRWHTGARENKLRELTWDKVSFGLQHVTVTFDNNKKSDKPRTFVLSDYSASVFKRLRDLAIAQPHRAGKFVFWTPKADHVFQLDRLPLTAPGDVRHLWTEAAMSIAAPYHIMRWLNGQNLKSHEIGMLGHYGRPDLDMQKEWADRISAYIVKRTAPATLVALPRIAVEMSA